MRLAIFSKYLDTILYFKYITDSDWLQFRGRNLKLAKTGPDLTLPDLKASIRIGTPI
jgi:hypothetical protein